MHTCKQVYLLFSVFRYLPFHTQLVYGERSCLQGRLEPPAAQVWRRRNSSKPREVLIFPMKEMDACLTWWMTDGEGQMGEWDYEQATEVSIILNFLDFGQLWLGIEMKMSHTYDSEVIFRSNLLCKEQPVRKPMSPVARPKGAWKILKDHDDRRFEYPTSLTREQWQQSAEKWQILRFHTISTSHPCSLPTSFA